MKLSTKGRYAVTALADIALNGDDHPVTLADVAGRQGISLAYLEQLFVKLRRGGLVTSVRGPGGGYRLARPADETRISDIMAAVDERLNAMACDAAGVEHCCKSDSEGACLTHALWERLSAHVHVFLSGITIADVIGDRLMPCPAVPDFITAVDGRVEQHARGHAGTRV